MSGDTRLHLRWPLALALAVLLVTIGAGGAYVLLRSIPRSTAAPSPQAGTTSTGTMSGPVARAADGPLRDVVITLTQEAIERAHIAVDPVVASIGAGTLRLPAVVEPNGYRQVVVTALVPGRVIRVLVELGAHVRRGQTMAEVFSPELAEAETRYITARAELEVHERELQRTEKLVQIGAASRQEMERIHAEHTVRKTDVASARSRLDLLGLSPATIDGLAAGKAAEARIAVPAPIAGTVTERVANTGLNVDPAAKLFTVVDMSTVWVVADLYEKDLSRVRVGDSGSITTVAFPDQRLHGRVSYIDPQVSPQTRTARLRFEVPNSRNELRLGMFAEVLVETSDRTSTIWIPSSAVQNVGSRSVVYLRHPGTSGQFTEREVRLGQLAGERVEIAGGLVPGDSVVTAGSFFVRAEGERAGVRTQSAAGGSPSRAVSEADGSAQKPDPQTAHVVVGERAFEPSRLTLRAGVPVRITFVRTSDKTCATEVTFPSLKITRPLPLNQPVVVELTPPRGELSFACGMDMLRGTIMVQ